MFKKSKLNTIQDKKTNLLVVKKCFYFVTGLQIYKTSGPSHVLYPRPIEEWVSLSHDEIGQSPRSFSFYLN